MRKPFQGVINIVRFNWHFYAMSTMVLLLLFNIGSLINSSYAVYLTLAIITLVAFITISLAVSFYVYDLSNLYSFNWLNKAAINTTGNIVNINAGFDETSSILKVKYPAAELIVLDFYDPQKHTEVSIVRARKAYPSFNGTLSISTAYIPLANHSIDAVCLILAAHEIRDEQERIHFFEEIKRIMKPNANIIVTEHLRDIPNFLAYNIGAFHFHSKPTWYRTFRQAGLFIQNQIKITPFITTFILSKNGTAS